MCESQTVHISFWLMVQRMLIWSQSQWWLWWCPFSQLTFLPLIPSGLGRCKCQVILHPLIPIHGSIFHQNLGGLWRRKWQKKIKNTGTFAYYCWIHNCYNLRRKYSPPKVILWSWSQGSGAWHHVSRGTCHEWPCVLKSFFFQNTDCSGN